MKWGDILDSLATAGTDFKECECECNDLYRIAAEHTTSQSALAVLAKSSDSVTRVMVASRIDNQALLWQMHDDVHCRVRQIVAERLKNEDLVWSMRCDGYRCVRIAVAKRQSSQERLLYMLSGEDSVTVRDEIEIRLAEIGDDVI